MVQNLNEEACIDEQYFKILEALKKNSTNGTDYSYEDRSILTGSCLPGYKRDRYGKCKEIINFKKCVT